MTINRAASQRRSRLVIWVYGLVLELVRSRLLCAFENSRAAPQLVHSRTTSRHSGRALRSPLRRAHGGGDRQGLRAAPHLHGARYGDIRARHGLRRPGRQCEAAGRLERRRAAAARGAARRTLLHPLRRHGRGGHPLHPLHLPDRRTQRPRGVRRLSHRRADPLAQARARSRRPRRARAGSRADTGPRVPARLARLSSFRRWRWERNCPTGPAFGRRAEPCLQSIVFSSLPEIFS